jgi:hypothetical protein
MCAAVIACLSVAGAGAGRPSELPTSDLFTGPGHMTELADGVAYQASQFPIAFRVTPVGNWSGTQWKANNYPPDFLLRRHIQCPSPAPGCQPPYYGWVGIGKGGISPTTAPKGLIVVESGFSPTPSVAATVDNLRTRGHGATYGDSSPVKVAGFSGVQFDGQVTGSQHVFIPFSPRTTKAKGFADAIEVEEPGQLFRFIVLNVRGKTVVVYLVNLGLPADQFPTFLTQADQILKSFQFPT